MERPRGLLLDIRHLRCFLAAAEHMNFTRAARELFLTQSAVSYQISALEKEVGVRLFERDPHQVSFTAAGRRFHEGIEGLLKTYGALVEEVQGLAQGRTGELVLGFYGVAEKRFLPPLLRRFRREHPTLRLETRRMDMVSMARALAEGGLDLAFLLEIACPSGPGMRYQQLFCEPLVAVLPLDHPLAQREGLIHADLAGERFVELELPINAPAHDSFADTCARSGFRPYIAQRYKDLESLFLGIEMGVGIALFPRYRAEAQAGPGQALVPMQGEAGLASFGVAWRTDNPNPILPVFLQAMGVRE
nr:LysR family transcriptional regulator [uncultured Holophaga sp.]